MTIVVIIHTDVVIVEIHGDDDGAGGARVVDNEPEGKDCSSLKIPIVIKIGKSPG